MVKTVRQETFTETVRENIDLLSLTPEEAIEETIEQFRTQGVDLSNIIKDISILNLENPVQILLKKFKSSNEEQEKIACVDSLTELCMKGMEYKLLCGSEGVYLEVMDELTSSHNNAELHNRMLDYLLTLLDGYPDLLDKRGSTFFISLLDEGHETQLKALQLISLSCINHEINKQYYFDGLLLTKLRTLMLSKCDDRFLKEIAAVVHSLTLDDDLRALVPKTHLHACSLADDLLIPLCSLLKEKEDDESSKYILKSLTCIIVRSEHCEIVQDQGSIPVARNIANKCVAKKSSLSALYKFLSVMAGNDSCKDEIMQCHFGEVIISSLNIFVTESRLFHTMVKLISILCLRRPSHSITFHDLGAPTVIVQGMNVHHAFGPIQVAGCWCIRNMICRNPHIREKFLISGAEELLNSILRHHPDYSHDVKVALADLGCNVNAIEPWTGKEGDKLKK